MIAALLLALATWQVILAALCVAFFTLALCALFAGAYEPSEEEREMQRTALKRYEGSD